MKELLIILLCASGYVVAFVCDRVWEKHYDDLLRQAAQYLKDYDDLMGKFIETVKNTEQLRKIMEDMMEEMKAMEPEDNAR